jgi:predicted metal-dependent phosphoesterase TrpH
MDQTLQDIRKWIRNHYSDAPNAPPLHKILQLYADPIVSALQSIETSSEWMRHDVRELQQSLKLPWVKLIDPPPRTLSAAQMEERLRDAVRRTRDIWREEMRQWARELGDDGDDFEVEEADVRALRRMTEVFVPLKALKSEESVRRTMDTVIQAAIARRVRKEERRRQQVARRLAKIRAEQSNAERELESRRAAAREQGLSVGIGKRAREHVPMGMLSARTKK